jgi:hypothetical protein
LTRCDPARRKQPGPTYPQPRRLTLETAVRDAAVGSLNAREIAEAILTAKLSREEFDKLVDAERTRLAGKTVNRRP